MREPVVHNLHYRQAVEQVFEEANFVRDAGIRLLEMGPGWVKTTLDVRPRHYQHTGFVHAGVLATMADHTGGCAATTLLRADEYVLSAGIALHLLRPAAGQSLICMATVLKPGQRLVAVESEVYSVNQDVTKMVAKATVTLAVLPKSDLHENDIAD